jgi:hypothetical protein
MKIYIIAASEEAMNRNEGTEIVASSALEAVDKYEAIGGEATHDGNEGCSVYVRLPHGMGVQAWVLTGDGPPATEEDLLPA